MSQKENIITVYGIAEESKAGSIIITDNGEVYYIVEIESWKDSEYQKRVKASGKVQTEFKEEKDLKTKDGGWIQGNLGTKKMLFDVKWEVIE